MEEYDFDPRVIAFVEYYSKELYDTMPTKTFLYKREESVLLIKQLMLMFLEQCVTNVAPITVKGT